jgi:hypothetical protein
MACTLTVACARAYRKHGGLGAPLYVQATAHLSESARALVVLRVLFVRIGKPEIVDRPLVLQLGGKRAVIACNHVGLGG